MEKQTKPPVLTALDPHLDREATRYDQPIASREHLAELIKTHQPPCTFEQVATLLQYEDPVSLEALERRLRAMVRDGQLISNKVDGFLPVDDKDLIRGRVIAHPDGFGFLHPALGNAKEDLFIPPGQMKSLLHGDVAMVRITGTNKRGRLEVALVHVLERANKRIVGRILVDAGLTYVVADNKRITQDIFIPADQVGDAKPGQIVLADITEQPTFRRQPVGRVREILGDHMAPGMEIDIAVYAHDLPNEWSPEVLSEIQQLSDQVADADKQGREDLRDKLFVTIDGEDAKDFDDAVYCETYGTGWRLYVAIADVAHYVRPDTGLDKEAFNRGNSVYFPGRVIPMLPEILSNGLCSLNPHVDRLAMVCRMDISIDGRIVDYKFSEAVFRSHARLTYNQVADMLVLRKIPVRKQFETVIDSLETLYELYHVFAKQRKKRGAIDLETTETRILFGENRKISAIIAVERNDAHKLIEECMIAANICAARFLEHHEIPGLFRVHDTPPLKKTEDFSTFLGEMGLKFAAREDIKPKDYSLLLDKIRERVDFHLIQTVLLRSLSQAEYNPVNCGHFGLALEEYAHFTSPIRRYPDLLVHRAIRHILRGGKVAQYHYSKDDMLDMAAQCSKTERRADEATRDATDWLKCEFMLDKVGESFVGIISSVTSFGLFVSLNDIHIEGLIHITSLSRDYYQFDPVGHRLVGEHSGQVYRLGDVIKVKVVRVSLDDRKIDFIPADSAMLDPNAAPRKNKKSQPADGDKPNKKKRGRSGKPKQHDKAATPAPSSKKKPRKKR
ncbi:MAG: ribonuclease R [Gammaproteobacteria bacterium]|nr:ribonuclease R [Gammaproteobacteria bacterium]